MVSRFLAWRLPDDFSPDASISFNPPENAKGTHWWPTGTNLFTASQAKAMFKCLVGDRVTELEAERDALRTGLELLAEGSTPWIDGYSDEPWEIMAKYAKQLLDGTAPPAEEKK